MTEAMLPWVPVPKAARLWLLIAPPVLSSALKASLRSLHMVFADDRIGEVIAPHDIVACWNQAEGYAEIFAPDGVVSDLDALTNAFTRGLLDIADTGASAECHTVLSWTASQLSVVEDLEVAEQFRLLGIVRAKSDSSEQDPWSVAFCRAAIAHPVLLRHALVAGLAKGEAAHGAAREATQQAIAWRLEARECLRGLGLPPNLTEKGRAATRVEGVEAAPPTLFGDVKGGFEPAENTKRQSWTAVPVSAVQLGDLEILDRLPSRRRVDVGFVEVSYGLLSAALNRVKSDRIGVAISRPVRSAPSAWPAFRVLVDRDVLTYTGVGLGFATSDRDDRRQEPIVRIRVDGSQSVVEPRYFQAAVGSGTTCSVAPTEAKKTPYQDLRIRYSLPGGGTALAVFRWRRGLLKAL